jgi:hypothetical protein
MQTMDSYIQAGDSLMAGKKRKSLDELVKNPEYEDKFVAIRSGAEPEIIAYDSDLSRLLEKVHEMKIAIASTFFVPRRDASYL